MSTPTTDDRMKSDDATDPRTDATPVDTTTVVDTTSVGTTTNPDKSTASINDPSTATDAGVNDPSPVVPAEPAKYTERYETDSSDVPLADQDFVDNDAAAFVLELVKSLVNPDQFDQAKVAFFAHQNKVAYDKYHGTDDK